MLFCPTALLPPTWHLSKNKYGIQPLCISKKISAKKCLMRYRNMIRVPTIQELRYYYAVIFISIIGIMRLAWSSFLPHWFEWSVDGSGGHYSLAPHALRGPHGRPIGSAGPLYHQPLTYLKPRYIHSPNISFHPLSISRCTAIPRELTMQAGPPYTLYNVQCICICVWRLPSQNYCFLSLVRAWWWWWWYWWSFACDEIESSRVLNSFSHDRGRSPVSTLFIKSP